jgi:hypothetical protein
MFFILVGLNLFAIFTHCVFNKLFLVFKQGREKNIELKIETFWLKQQDFYLHFVVFQLYLPMSEVLSTVHDKG